MMNDSKRAELLAEVGPSLVVAVEEITGQTWIFVPQEAADFALLVRPADGMRLGMMPGWFEPVARFEFSPFIRFGGVAHTLASLGLIPEGGRSLRIQASMTRGIAAVAADVVRRLVTPFEPLYERVRERIGREIEAADVQRQVADGITGLTGARQERRGGDINLWPEVGGVSLPLRVAPGGTIELGQTHVSRDQLAAIVAGLKRADRLRPAQRAV